MSAPVAEDNRAQPTEEPREGFDSLNDLEEPLGARLRQAMDRTLRRFRGRLVRRCGGEVSVPMVARVTKLREARRELLSDDDALAGVVRMDPGQQQGLLVVEPLALHRVVALLLGDRQPSALGARRRAATTFDTEVAHRVATDLLHSLVEGAPGGALQQADLDGFCSPTMVAGPLAPGAAVLQIGFAVGATSNTEEDDDDLDDLEDVGDRDEPTDEVEAGAAEGAQFEGFVWLVLPIGMFRSWWPGQQKRAPSGQSHEPQVDRVLPLPITVVAELARFELPVSRIQRLAAGDVLDLGAGALAELRVEGKSLYIVEPGEQSGLRSVRIKRRLSGVPVPPNGSGNGKRGDSNGHGSGNGNGGNGHGVTHGSAEKNGNGTSNGQAKRNGRRTPKK